VQNGGLFDIPAASSNYDATEADFLEQQKLKKKKKKRGFKL
jgi:hypothetical protein